MIVANAARRKDLQPFAGLTHFVHARRGDQLRPRRWSVSRFRLSPTLMREVPEGVKPDLCRAMASEARFQRKSAVIALREKTIGIPGSEFGLRPCKHCFCCDNTPSDDDYKVLLLRSSFVNENFFSKAGDLPAHPSDMIRNENLRFC